MNDAHLHLLTNHFPIVGSIIGTFILLVAIIVKSRTMQNTAYVIFIFCMVLGKSSMMTGEGAEHIVEELGISHDIIHEHEEKAEVFMKFLYLLALSSSVGIYFNVKKHSKSKIIAIATLIIAIVVSGLSKNVATSGGEIRHTEIRENPESIMESITKDTTKVE